MDGPQESQQLMGGLLKEISSTKHGLLIFANVDKANYVPLKSGILTSVNFDAAMGRLKGLCAVHIVKNQFGRLDKLRNLRNVAEHFALPANPKQMNSPARRRQSRGGLLHRKPNDVDLKSPGRKQITRNHRQVDHFVKEKMENFGAAYSSRNRVLDWERCPRRGRLTGRRKSL